ncbi:methyl-accepting chemotaxis protein [Pseudomonas matsuisoli]|uniref:Methyl-accepting chemotaxis protein n=1 Tax=Pseudomonas matsuisoli TaxID=1515666 RepID=A0A917UTJ6_9PSED|nr:methyl-accepting chemotaxis protein [Pseudomonas matsuisoli]GGJ84051.1 methyl-accepting chemotaxis protein [Pseudomonas matsuisoli]
MSMFLSWKQKFHLLILVTLAGLALMALTALWVNQSLSAALDAQERATAYGGLTTTLSNDWLKLEGLRERLSAPQIPAFTEQLARIEPAAEQLVEQAKTFDDARLQQNAESIATAVKANVGLQREWLALQQRFGLEPSQGERKAAVDAAAPLEAISIALIQPAIAKAISAQRDYLSTQDRQFAQATREAIEELRNKLVELDWTDSQIGQNAEAFAARFAQVDALIQQIVTTEKTLSDGAQHVDTQLANQQQMLRDGVLAKALAQAEHTRRSGYWLLGAAFGIIAFVLLLSIITVSRRLMAQLDRVIQQLNRVAGGDLRASLEIGRNPRDEFNQLGQGTNGMTRGISNLIGQVLEGNNELTRLHTHLSDAMRQLDNNSSQLESQTEQAASASQQIAATVNEMARRASDVGDATQHANDSAHTGAEVVLASAESIRALSRLIQNTHGQVNALIQSSTQVTGIVDVINSLADQTNLLALNAAIEAARAGDAGRGFSVVADEVRSLAQKTVSATTDIAHIINELKLQTESMDTLMNDGVRLANEGERQAGEAAGAIDVITQSMDRLSAEMTQVVVAIEEISATTEDIAAKMEDIHRSNHETRQLRTALDDHTHSLSRRVQSLSETTGRFQIA